MVGAAAAIGHDAVPSQSTECRVYATSAANANPSGDGLRGPGKPAGHSPHLGRGLAVGWPVAARIRRATVHVAATGPQVAAQLMTLRA
jgi:hypothetical protein